jgi:hypothetical protein
MPTLLQIAQGRQVPLTMGLFMAVRTEVPLLTAFDARSSTDDKYLSLAVTSLPSSSFAHLGEGFAASEGALELREFSCSLIGGLIRAELISAAKWDRTHQNSGYTWFDLQTMLKMKADMLNIERQMILGTLNDAKGFPGAKEMTPYSAANSFTMTQTAQDYGFAKSVLNVGGSAANTGSSVYSFIFGELDAQLVWGNDSQGELFQVTERIRQAIAPDANQPTKTLMHDMAQVQGWIGMSVAGFNQMPGGVLPTQYSVRRATNITTDTNNKCTDAVIDKLVRSHGTGRRPNLLAMSGRSGEQLAASRSPTAVNFVMGASGDASQATYTTYPPPPENWQGIPIVYPDCIGSSDAIEA